MRRKHSCFDGIVCLAFVFTTVAHASSQDDLSGTVRTFVDEHCASCHTGATSKGGLDLVRLEADLDDPDLLHRWTQIYDRVANGEMPPKSEARPPAEAVRTFLDQLGKNLMSADSANRQSVLRRLNRVEYENTVCDLFGIRAELKENLSEDPSAHGFDTVGEALEISAEQMELYLRAADQVISQVLRDDREPAKVSVRMPLGLDPLSSRGIGDDFVKTDDHSLVIFTGHYVPAGTHAAMATADGTYRIRIQAKTYQSKQPLVMAVYGGDIFNKRVFHLVGYYDVTSGDEWTNIEFEDYLKKNEHHQMVPYRLRLQGKGADLFKGPGLMIGEVSVEGPLEPWPPVGRKDLLGNVDPKKGTISDAREILTRLLPRAFRRRVKPSEVESFLALTQSAVSSGRPFLDGLSLSLKAILCSPEFLMREEPLTSQPPSLAPTISQEALASRISYFLWSSMPDDELLSRAAEGQLTQPDVMHAEVERMLRDPKSERFVENFAGQWLGLRNIRFTEPDAKLYPEFDEMLRYSMVEETRRFFREILDRDLTLLDFVDSDWAILNSRLALHYGIDGVNSQSFRRVTLPPVSVRGGVLTQASVLKVLANGTTTSPVVRGTWVLNNILGQPTPPPPADVPSIEPDLRGAGTMREQLQKHRSIESCAVCHNRIDPPGLAMENFDPIGGWRRRYRTLSAGEKVWLEINGSQVEFRAGRAVTASSKMHDGRMIANISDLKKILLEDKNQIARCLTVKLLTYSLGREVGFSDRQAVTTIVTNVERQKYGFRTLIHEVIKSPLFQKK